MECFKCKADGTFHSFEFITRLPSGEGVFYTSPASAKHRNMKEEDILDFVAHMDQASISSWVWVFDCSGLEHYHLPSSSILRKFVDITQERYKFVLKKVYIININWKMNIILSLIKPFMKDEAQQRIKVLQNRLETVACGLGNPILQKMRK